MSEVDSLSKSTDELLDQFSRRVEKMKGRKEYAGMIRKLDIKAAKCIAASFFGEGEYRAVGIDGSMEQAETLEMLLFYVNAVAYSSPFKVGKDGINFFLNKMKKEEKIGASSAIPLWIEDLGLVSEQETDSGLESELISSLSDVSFSLMLFAELTAAERASEDDDVRILFLDRLISGTFQSLGWDVRQLLKRGKSALSKLYGKELLRDAYLINALPFEEAEIFPHGPGRLHIILRRMVEGVSFDEACNLAGLKEEEKKKVSAQLNQRDKKLGFLQDGNRLKNDCFGFRKRLYSLADQLTERIFSSERHPLKVDDEWLTTKDLNFINLVKLVRLIENCKEKRCLLLGITKDTSSKDVSRSVIPLMGLPDETRPGLRHDRVMFTILSATNEEEFIPPWRSIGYDAVFATLSSNDQTIGGKTPQLRAARRVAARERIFVKCFFQTRASESTIFRSPVFLYDRPFCSDFDEKYCSTIDYVENDKIEKIYPYLEKTGNNEFDNMILYILSISDYPEVFEAFGHNALLYIADKAAKVDVKLKKGLLLGIINLKLTPLARKEKLFTVIRRYRDARTEMEASRADTAYRTEYGS